MKKKLFFKHLLATLLCVIIVSIAGYSQTKKVTLNLRNTNVESVLKEVEQQTGYHFLYNNRLIDVKVSVNISANDEPLTNVLKKIFPKGDVVWMLQDNQIALSPASNQAQKAVGLVKHGE